MDTSSETLAERALSIASLAVQGIADVIDAKHSSASPAFGNLELLSTTPEIDTQDISIIAHAILDNMPEMAAPVGALLVRMDARSLSPADVLKRLRQLMDNSSP